MKLHVTQAKHRGSKQFLCVSCKNSRRNWSSQPGLPCSFDMTRTNRNSFRYPSTNIPLFPALLPYIIPSITHAHALFLSRFGARLLYSGVTDWRLWDAVRLGLFHFRHLRARHVPSHELPCDTHDPQRRASPSKPLAGGLLSKPSQTRWQGNLYCCNP